LSHIPVTERGASGRLVGVISRYQMMKALSAVATEAMGGRSASPPGGERVALEVEIDEASPLLGRKVRDLDLPPGVRLVALRRDGAEVPERDSATLAAKDRLEISLPHAFGTLLRGGRAAG